MSSAKRRQATSKKMVSRGKEPQGAVRRVGGWRDRLESYRGHHRQVAGESLRRLLRQPAASLMTALVVAIALALPSGLYVALKNIESLAAKWDGSARISLFLKTDVGNVQAKSLVQTIATRTEVASVDYVSPDQALQEFRESSGFGEVLDQLDSNPLPGLIVVTPEKEYAASDKLAILRVQLGELSAVELAKLDMEWVQRLNRITELARRMTLVLAAMLALGVLLIVGNTIKLAVESRRSEILVVKLVGGTNAFVRRPFLYTGFWYGLAGGVLAWLLLQLALIWLRGPVSDLSALYKSPFALQGLGVFDSVMLWFFASILGLVGAWLVVGRELRLIEPR
ncbi:MAG: permease-like cell division protein FtsX [Spongiibacteraceae bacterium]